MILNVVHVDHRWPMSAIQFQSVVNEESAWQSGPSDIFLKKMVHGPKKGCGPLSHDRDARPTSYINPPPTWLQVSVGVFGESGEGVWGLIDTLKRKHDVQKLDLSVNEIDLQMKSFLKQLFLSFVSSLPVVVNREAKRKLFLSRMLWSGLQPTCRFFITFPWMLSTVLWTMANGFIRSDRWMGQVARSEKWQ